LSLARVEAGGKAGEPLARARIAIQPEWTTLTGRLEILAADCKPEALHRFAVTFNAPANVVLGRVLLYPEDHVHFADPDVIRFLKEARLPLMRWPGGNFVSGYRWLEGTGPVDARPTVPNPAWEGLEYNLFGTDEFLALCRTIGCEPLICVNAGDGTPEEAAMWVQYCNGSTEDTPLGHLRAESGHPEPYRVKLWEVGNEIYGRWQVSWTTPGGNADRYLRFRAAMLKADPTIQLLACGAQGDLFGEWNRALLKAASGDTIKGDPAPGRVRCITDHILTGGGVNAGTDPVELYHAFMGQAVDVGEKYRRLRQMMLESGIREPRWAITELQLFAHFQGKAEPGAKLTPATMPTPATISEALYHATIVHECIRLGDFVELFTHSATVNHGGGLRKTRERVWANPVHYGHVLGAAFFNATPVAVRLASGTFSTQRAYGYIPPLKDVPVLDALAALSADGESLVVMLVHRCATSGPVTVSLEIKDFAGAGEAEVMTLAGAAAHDQNTAEEPERIVPRPTTVRVDGGKATLTLVPFSLTRVTVRRK
jgi:alpha-N-arabinofuranosidase